MHARTEDHAFAFKLADALVDEMLLHLEVRNAVAEQAADPIRLLEHRRCMTRPGQLLSAGEPCGPRAHDCDTLARTARRELRFQPALIKSSINDLALDRFDRYRIVVDVQNARGFARGRTDSASELGEVVGRVQVVARGLPVVAEDKIVPVRNLIVDRAARRSRRDRPGALAERNPAIHAARGLGADLRVVHALQELGIVLLASIGLFVSALFLFVFEEACGFAHVLCSLNSTRPRRWCPWTACPSAHGHSRSA